MSSLEQPATPALEVEGLTKAFPGTIALDDVRLEIRPGEIHALMGQNGSGKSTLIKVLAGFHQPDGYTLAHAAGVPLHLGDPAAARAAGLRFVHQDLGLVASLGAVDNLALGVGYATSMGVRVKWREQRALARQAIESLGYSFDVRVPAEQLQAVERTAIAIARALHGLADIHVLVLDEPTAAMPHHDVERLHELVRRVTRRNVGVLYVSHHIDEVMDLADRVTVLRDGRNVATRAVRDITPATLIELMTGGVVDEADASDTRTPREQVALQLRNLSGHTIRELDLDVRAGEVVGVAGLSGSGRGELCGLIFGGRSRTGTVAVDGVQLPERRPDVAVATGVGYLPGDRHGEGLVMSMTIKENLSLVDLRRYRRGPVIRGSEERRDGRQWMAQLGVRAPNIATSVESLSGGNQQKVALGKWLRLAPRVLLLEEPTQGVDVAAKAELHLLIDHAAAAGTAVVVCSSDEDELERLCDRVVVLRRGRAAAHLRRPNLTSTLIAAESLSDAQPEGAVQ